MGLVWNSMMSMAGGWFFLMICETFQLPGQDFRRPGLGSYMQAAMDAERTDAMFWALFAMLLMIVALDQLLWRPVVVWSQKFRVEEGGEQTDDDLLVLKLAPPLANCGLFGAFYGEAVSSRTSQCSPSIVNRRNNGRPPIPSSGRYFHSQHLPFSWRF